MGEAGNKIWGRVQTIWESSFTEMRSHTRASTQGGAFTFRLWFYAERCFYKGMLLLAGALTQRYFQHRDAFNTEMLLHTGAFRYKYFHTEMILLTNRYLYTGMLLHRCFYMLIRLQYTVLYAQILLRWDSFTRKHFYTEALWHTVAGTFTCKYFYTAVFILRAFSLHACKLSEGCLWSYMLLHRDIFTRRHLCTERNAFLHTNTFTERWFYCEQFYTKTKTNRGAFTKECMCTKGF